LNAVVHTDPMIQLHLAAEKVIATSPVDSLKLIDCDPAGVASLAREVDFGREHFNQAHAQYVQGVQHARNNWHGGMAAAGWAQDAASVDLYYKKSLDATADTIQRGNTVAGQLDQVAGRTGENAFQIAEAVQPSSQAVIAGQDVPEDVDNVIRATEDIRALVTYALGQISAMADDFAGLIEPQGLPANWPR
jgi:hypothetical protein